jgi:hypothetical protein
MDTWLQPYDDNGDDDEHDDDGGNDDDSTEKMSIFTIIITNTIIIRDESRLDLLRHRTLLPSLEGTSQSPTSTLLRAL